MPLPEILQKPKQQQFWRFDIQNHPCTNCFCQREWDEVSHWTRQTITFFILELDLFITLIASIGVLAAIGLGGGSVPSFTEVFSNTETALLALLVFLVVPVILVVVQLVCEAVLGLAEDEEKNIYLRYFLFFLFWLIVILFFILLVALILGLGITNQQAVIQVAAVIWGIRLFINWVIFKPIYLTLLYIIRKYVGRERTANEDPRFCPEILCCKDCCGLGLEGSTPTPKGKNDS